MIVKESVVEEDFFCEYQGSKVRLCKKPQQGSRNSNKQKERKPYDAREHEKNCLPILFISHRLGCCCSRCRRTPKRVATVWSDTGGPKQSLATISGGSFEGQWGKLRWCVSRGYLSWDPQDGAFQMRLSQLAAPLSPLLPSGLLESASSSGAGTFFLLFRATCTLSLLLWLIPTPLKPLA